MKTRAFALFTGLLLFGMPLAASCDISLPGLDTLTDLYKSAKQAFVPATEEEEIAIGHDAAATLLGASKPITNQAVQDYVNKVGLWIALQSDRPGLPWHFA